MSTTIEVENLKLTPIESVEIRSADADELEVLVTYLHGDPPPKHFHPEQDERFEVTEGTVRVELDGEVRDLEPGDSLEIPRGAVHRLWNPTEEAARAIWQTTPAGRTEQWFRASTRCTAKAAPARTDSPARSPSASCSASTTTSSGSPAPAS
jgi:quercetin dioxygenase-like cupin family protein